MSPHLVLINEASGRASEEGADVIAERLEPILEEYGGGSFNVAEVPELIEAAKSFEGRSIITVGGDGTIAAIASALYQREDQPTLIPLPYGTANLVPRDIGMPLDPTEALARSLEAGTRKIDFVEANGRALLHSAAFGAFAEIAEGREDLRSAPTFDDALGASLSMWEQFIDTHATPYRLNIDGEERVVESSALFVANGAISGGEGILPQRNFLDRGEIVLYISKGRGVLGLLQHIAEAITGRWDDSEEFERITAQQVIVSEADEELHYTIDGEPGRGEKALKFTMHACSLTVPDLREAQD
ncbi:hypothetical protein HK107_07730 [Parvularcula sp. ZS-1/3]|uniref:DAGKc domain-containing protein n=1 Tax=Parvularcula mediterranea TaxID=2732508 RepID=A0A7Y3W571_9PROT|nr:diacylglycerol kinase family protein [Parvularcula mediterranea]NNU16208.1 hypothetical protein [Parvularcula mediterranea]